MTVMGDTVASSRTVLIRKRPSAATSYCRFVPPSWPPPTIRVRNSVTGEPGSRVVPCVLMGAAIIEELFRAVWRDISVTDNALIRERAKARRRSSS
jgi:hypothetical protein